MSSASDEINNIIDQALATAAGKAADAGFYAQAAINATDTLVYNEGSGQWTYAPSTSLQDAGTINVPSIDDPSADYATISQEITSELTNAFTNVLATFFPNDAGAHGEAVGSLQALADQGVLAGAVMLTRMNGGQGGIDYANAAFGPGATGRNYALGRMEAGSMASSYLQTKFGAGNQAANFLAGLFVSGNAAAVQLITMLTSGGTGLPAALEDQVWERDRARILKEAGRVRDQTVGSWAARGFPLPPGALVNALEMTESDAQDKISQFSRDVAIKQIDTYIENIRTAAEIAARTALDAGKTVIDDASMGARVTVEDAQAAMSLTVQDAEQAARLLVEDSMAAARALVEVAAQAAGEVVKLRAQAVSAAVEYMRALAVGPEAGAQVTSAISNARVAAAETVVKYFEARVQAASSYNSSHTALEQLKLENARGSADNATRLHIAYGSTLVGIAQAKSTAALGAAQAAGTQGAAALSTLNAIASLASSG